MSRSLVHPTLRDVEPLTLVTESALDANQLETVTGWGGALQAASYVYRPSTLGQIRALLLLAQRANRPIVVTGAGRSYGDPFLLAEGIQVNLSRMNRILAWDPDSGLIDVEPGVTLRDLWRYGLGDGFWPPVSTGTANTTVGGMVSMNAHGKNSFRVGSFGEHVQELDVLLADGRLITVSPSQQGEIFRAVIGGFGLFGIVTRIRVAMKPIETGLLSVRPTATRTLRHMLELWDDASRWDYLVGWIDTTAGGSRRGRGLAHAAEAVPASPGSVAHSESLSERGQLQPDHVLGVAKSQAWRFMRPFINRLGMRGLNTAKYWSGVWQTRKPAFEQPLAHFNFLLDFFPDWKRAYGRGGLIQFQPFVPVDQAEAVFLDILARSQKAGLPPYLGVLKRHKRDPFLMSYNLEGYSLALDYKVTQRNRAKLFDLCRRLADDVITAGGQFYFAKDAILTAEHARRMLDAGDVERFWALKKRLDPESRFQSELARRLFPEYLSGSH